MFFWPVEPALPVKKVVPRVEMQRRLQKGYVASAEHASRANRHMAACFIQKSRKAILIGRSALFLSCQAVLRCVSSLGPGRRAPRRCHALWRPTYNCTACPRSGNCKSSVRQKPPVMRAVSVHNVVCPEADIMRHDAEIYARGAAGPVTNVSYFVGAGFWRWRKSRPRKVSAEEFETKFNGSKPVAQYLAKRCPDIAGQWHCSHYFLPDLSHWPLCLRKGFRRRHYHPHAAQLCG